MASLPSADGGAMKAPQHVLAPQHATPGGSGRLDRPWRPLPQSWEARQRGGGPVQAQDSEHGYPFGSDPLDKRFPSAEGLPLSLYTPYDELPPDGQVGAHRKAMASRARLFSQRCGYPPPHLVQSIDPGQECIQTCLLTGPLHTTSAEMLRTCR
eukprot:evm.model.scf_3198.1 EVM.evm.TU.scf_3198.1   scf_3198:2930-3682(-)